MKNRGKIFLFSLLLMAFFAPNFAVAQKDSIKRARAEELIKKRKELWTTKLSLTETEAKNFFPLVDEYQLKLRAARQEFRKKWKGKKPEDLTETEASTYLDDALKLRETELTLFKTYSAKFRTVIPAKKVVRIPKVEKEIEKELKIYLREMRRKK